MKILKWFFLVFIVLFISCKKNIKLEKRIAYKIIFNDSVHKYDLYLSIEKKDSVIDYKYVNKDSIKSFGFRYYIRKDLLVGHDVFSFKNNEFIFQKESFKLYGIGQGNGASSHPWFLLFNKKYGVLANITYGADFVFLKDSTNNDQANLLLKKIINKLNE